MGFILEGHQEEVRLKGWERLPGKETEQKCAERRETRCMGILPLPPPPTALKPTDSFDQG